MAVDESNAGVDMGVDFASSEPFLDDMPLYGRWCSGRMHFEFLFAAGKRMNPFAPE